MGGMGRAGGLRIDVGKHEMRSSSGTEAAEVQKGKTAA